MTLVMAFRDKSQSGKPHRILSANITSPENSYMMNLNRAINPRGVRGYDED